MSPRFLLCRRCWDWKPKESSADTDGIGGACKAHTEQEENNQEEEERDLRFDARLRLDGVGDSTASGSGGISGSGGVPTANLFTKSAGGGISGTGNVQSTMLRKVSPTTESEEQLRARLDEAVDGGKLNLFGIPLAP